MKFFEDCGDSGFVGRCCRSEEAVEFAAGGRVEADAGGFLAVRDADEVIGLVFVGR